MKKTWKSINKTPYLNTGTDKRILISIAIFLIVALGTASAFTDQERLGKKLFFDTNLSIPAGQGCVSCHDPAFAFTDPDKDRGVSAGIVSGRFGSRNAPSAAYAAFTPEFSFAVDFSGGMFWDGRAANLTEQAKGPFLNPLEMNNPDKAAVLSKINTSEYANLFDKVCGASPDQYTCMAASIAAFEKTKEFNKFSSKFDFNPIGLTPQETRGRILFNGKAGCAACHPEPFFTTFGYANIGVPSNLGMIGDSPDLKHYFPFYYPPLVPEFNPAGLKFKDAGLANNLNVPSILKPGARGLMKIPTLRNVEITGPYMHSGVFKDIKTVVHFYNTRDALDNCANTIAPQPGVNCWPAPEVPLNLNIAIGNLQLTDDEENDIAAFLKTLTDGFVPGATTPTPQEQLGKNVFFDTSLSRPKGQGCVSCHDPKAAFTAPDKTRGVSEGATAGRFGNRNAPSTLYAALTPDFGFVNALFSFNGGMFWDERAQNLTEQAKGPFLNPLEMNNLNINTVINGIKKSAYRGLFDQVCGGFNGVDLQFNCVAESIAAFEKTKEMNNFTSKLDVAPTGLTIQETRGRVLFNGKGNCAVCHPEPFFTDFDSENIGVPSNLGMLGDSPALQTYFPFYYEPEFNPAGLKFADKGLANNPNVPLILRTQSKGLIKAPSLRNINLTGPYMHNGVFKDLKTVVHFYNTRDLLGDCADAVNPQPGVNCWPAPEVRVNLNEVVGNLGLTDAEENDIVAFLKTLSDGFVPQPPPVPTAQEQLGKLLFFDTNLSTPEGQGCVSCHDPLVAFTEPDKDRGVSQGIIPERFGSRNAPSTAYAAFAPDLAFGNEAGVELVFIGGMFWDGRAQNLTEQAKGPFLNKLEMNNPDKAAVLSKISASAYANLFNQVCGASPDKYTCMAAAIAAFEKTKEMNKFSSKFDLEMSELKEQEMRGFALFNGKAKCAACHISAAVAFEQPLFTDFDYENIGVPSNLGMLENNTTALQTYFPFYYPPLVPEFNPAGLKFQDIGLAGNPNVPSIMKPTLRGLMKTPTLRNVELTAPYMHNGVFKDLKTVVHFYNTRDTLGNCGNMDNPQPGVNCWPAPEVPVNLNVIVGNLGLTDAEEDDIVTFLKTLTDR